MAERPEKVTKNGKTYRYRGERYVADDGDSLSLAVALDLVSDIAEGAIDIATDLLDI